MAYLLITQDQVRAELYTRAEGGAWMMHSYDQLEQHVPLNVIDATLLLAEVYDKVDLETLLSPKAMSLLDRARLQLELETQLELPVDLIVQESGAPVSSFQHHARAPGLYCSRNERTTIGCRTTSPCQPAGSHPALRLFISIP